MNNPIEVAFPIKVARMTLRPLIESDREAFRDMQEASRDFFAPWAARHDTDEIVDSKFDAELSRSVEGMQHGKDLRLSGFLSNGTMAGQFHLNEIVRGFFQNAYAGWKVHARLARQGFGREGVQAMLDIAFAEPPRGLALHRVQAAIIPHNAPSIALARSCGFRHEGVCLRYLRIAGQWQDHAIFAKLVDEHKPRYVK